MQTLTNEALTLVSGGAPKVIGIFKDGNVFVGTRKGIEVISRSRRGPWIQAGPVPPPGM